MVHTDADSHGISENFIRGYCKENGNISKTVSEVVEEITKSQLITNNLDEINPSRPFYYGYNTGMGVIQENKELVLEAKPIL